MSLAAVPEFAEPQAGDTSRALRSRAPFTCLRGSRRVRIVPRYGRGAIDANVRYLWAGVPGAPTVIVQGGISADRDACSTGEHPAPGWWEALVGVDRAIDLGRLRVLAIDWLDAEGLGAPSISTADQADALAALLDALGLARVEAFVGASYGAMVGLQFAARHPRRLRRLCAISGTHRAHPYASAWRALQRQAVALGALQCDEADGLALARQLALLSYRTPEEFATRFASADVVAGRVRVGAEDYLRHCGAKYVARTTPIAFLRLSESIDLQCVDPARIAIPVDVVAVAEERLVPIEDACELVECLPGARLHVLRSIYGHDAFLKENRHLKPIFATALNDIPGSHP